MSVLLPGFRIEPEFCPDCRSRITEISAGRSSELEPDEPQRFGCGCLATGYLIIMDRPKESE